MKAKQTRMRCNLREIIFGSILASKPIPVQLQHVLRGRGSDACGGWDEGSLYTGMSKIGPHSNCPAFNVFNRYEPHVEQALLSAPLPALVVPLPPPLGDRIGRVLPST